MKVSQGAGSFVFLPEQPGAQLGSVEWRADHRDVHDLIGGNIHDQLTEQILRVGACLSSQQAGQAVRLPRERASKIQQCKAHMNEREAGYARSHAALAPAPIQPTSMGSVASFTSPACKRAAYAQQCPSQPECLTPGSVPSRR